MEIQIGNLPPQTTAMDLNRLFGFPANPPRCRVFRKQTRDGRIVHYGLANVRPDTAAQRLLERFRNVHLNGIQLEVREYVARRVGNERRALNWRDQPWHGPERRCSERRGGSFVQGAVAV